MIQKVFIDEENELRLFLNKDRKLTVWISDSYSTCLYVCLGKEDAAEILSEIQEILSQMQDGKEIH